MLKVTNSASEELKKVMNSEQAKGKELVITFQGYGWGGPSLGMTLDESIEGLKKLESNGINAYIDNDLAGNLLSIGKINIDFVKPQFGRAGYTITVGEKKDCGGCSC